jgi:GNAT superfamily N-acetyltransferase
MAIEVRRIERGDLLGSLVSLSRAFYDDPIFGYFQPDLLRQQRRLHRMMRAVASDCLPFGETWVARVDGRPKGVAAWLPPGAYPRGAGRDTRLAMGSISAVALSPRRMLEGSRLMVKVDRRHPKFTHWYLALLGVDPEFQGRGVGAALLEPVLARLDEEELPAYLETQKWDNVAWYANRGFEMVEEVRMPGASCPPVWLLLRQPRSPAEKP